MQERVRFDIRHRSAWRAPPPRPEDQTFLIIEERIEPPHQRVRPKPRRRRVQIVLAAAALLLLLFAIAGDPVQANIRTPYTTEVENTHEGPVGPTDMVALRVQVVATDRTDVQVVHSGSDLHIELPYGGADLGLRIQDFTPSDTIKVVLPSGTTRTVWTDAEGREVARGYAPGTVPLDQGHYRLVWSSDVPRQDGTFRVDVVRLMDEPVFDSAALMHKVTLGLGAIVAATAAVALHFGKGLGRIGDLVLDEASALWDRLRQRVDR